MLVYLAGLDTKQAIATSLVVVGMSALTGMFEHAREGRIQWKTGIAFGLAAMAGAFPGGWSAQFFSAQTLMIGFASLMMVAGVAMLRPKKTAEDGTSEGGSEKRVSWVIIMIEGLAVGFFTGLVGAGGGFLIVPALVLLAGMDMKKAIGTSLLVMAMKSVAAIAGQLMHVELDVKLVVVVTLAAMVGALIGAWSARLFSAKHLRKAFGVFVLVLAVHMVWKELNRSKDEAESTGTEEEVSAAETGNSAMDTRSSTMSWSRSPRLG